MDTRTYGRKSDLPSQQKQGVMDKLREMKHNYQASSMKEANTRRIIEAQAKLNARDAYEKKKLEIATNRAIKEAEYKATPMSERFMSAMTNIASANKKASYERIAALKARNQEAYLRQKEQRLRGNMPQQMGGGMSLGGSFGGGIGGGMSLGPSYGQRDPLAMSNSGLSLNRGLGSPQPQYGYSQQPQQSQGLSPQEIAEMERELGVAPKTKKVIYYRVKNPETGEYEFLRSTAGKYSYQRYKQGKQQQYRQQPRY